MRTWQATRAGESTPLLVFLLTPKHVGLLDNLEESIGAHLHKIHAEALDEVHPVEVLIAVIDRIPKSEGRREVDSAQATPNEGCEGVSIAFLDSSDAAPDLWAPRQNVTRSETMSIQQRCTISFSLCKENDKQPLQTFQLPVANTLFLNGRTSTLLAQHWVKQPSNDHEQRTSFKLKREKALPEQVINLRFPSLSESSLTCDLHSFLTPMTKPRVVATSVGNIIQKMYFDDGSKALPASQELEEAIQKRVQEGETPNGPIEVWAMIKPRGLKESFSGVTADALQQGCQLRKVLSGGGGWGVKQGLLSLDPDSEYRLFNADPQSVPSADHSRDQMSSRSRTHFSTNNPSRKDEATNPPSIFGNDDSPNMFEDLVKPGDTITFLVNKLPKDRSLMPATLGGDSTDQKQDCPTGMLQFGTLPSTIDAPLSISNNRAEPELQEQAVVVANCFGMLSEQGMSFEVSRLGFWNLRQDGNSS